MNLNDAYLARITTFVKEFLMLLKQIRSTTINKPLIEQATRSAASIGANYHEAVEAESRRDFIHKLSICKKETKETLYWIELLASQNQEKVPSFRKCWKEAHEFLLIFSKSIKTTKDNSIAI